METFFLCFLLKKVICARSVQVIVTGRESDTRAAAMINICGGCEYTVIWKGQVIVCLRQYRSGKSILI